MVVAPLVWQLYAGTTSNSWPMIATAAEVELNQAWSQTLAQ
jgi:hypothetical protein